jgi:hypothetical protein
VRGEEVRAPLLRALAGFDRLVLLGDVLELRQGPVREALRASEAVFRDLAAALGSGRQIIIVPGNHDHHLLGPWLERRSLTTTPAPLGLQTAVSWGAGEALAAIAGWLDPVDVEVAYPGVWLRPDTFAMHGHYGDRHTTVPLLERLGAGVMARVVREAPAGPRRAEDYEATLAPIYAWIHAVAQAGAGGLGAGPDGASAQAWHALSGHGRGRGLRRRTMVAAFAVLIAALNRAHVGPLRTDLSPADLRRASLRAFIEVLSRLDVDAPHVIFGHTHRAGPQPDDDQTEWRSSSGAHLINTGCWVHEPGFLGPAPHTSPYRAGFAAVLDADTPPKLVNLLDR